MFNIHLPSGKQFRSDPEEPLIDAAARQGVVLPYSCRTGRCSTCKCRVLKGETKALAAETGLSAAEQSDGWILGCVRSAQTDLILDLEDLGDIKLPPPRTIPCRIQSLTRLSPEVMQVRLRLPPASPLNFLPGQYVDVIGPNSLRRAYSIACAPQADQSIELHIRRVEDGQMSQYWFDQARPNDLLRLHGPLGTFFLRPAADKHLICLATGTGMAPVKAMLEGLATSPPSDPPESIHVYWGARAQADFYWDPGSLKSPLRFVPVLSRADTDWSGRRGWVTDALMADNLDLERSMVYACGSEAMIHTARARLMDAGLPPGRFFSDAFVASTST